MGDLRTFPEEEFNKHAKAQNEYGRKIREGAEQEIRRRWLEQQYGLLITDDERSSYPGKIHTGAGYLIDRYIKGKTTSLDEWALHEEMRMRAEQRQK